MLARPRNGLCGLGAAAEVEIMSVADSCEAGSMLAVECIEFKDQLAAGAAQGASFRARVQVSQKRASDGRRRMNPHLCVSRAAQATGRQHQFQDHGVNSQGIDGTLLARSPGSVMLSHSATRACPGDIRISPGSLQCAGCDGPHAHAWTRSVARAIRAICVGTVSGPDGVHGCLEWYAG